MLISQNWYDLYEAQKSVNIEGNGTNVQTAMIYGVLWDETMAFITKYDTNYDVNTFPSSATSVYRTDSSKTYAGPYLDSNGDVANSVDVTLNIYGLGSNRFEWTQESCGGYTRVVRSDAGYNDSFGAMVRIAERGIDGYYLPNQNEIYFASRMIMYIL